MGEWDLLKRGLVPKGRTNKRSQRYTRRGPPTPRPTRLSRHSFLPLQTEESVESAQSRLLVSPSFTESVLRECRPSPRIHTKLSALRFYYDLLRLSTTLKCLFLRQSYSSTLCRHYRHVGVLLTRGPTETVILTYTSFLYKYSFLPVFSHQLLHPYFLYYLSLQLRKRFRKRIFTQYLRKTGTNSSFPKEKTFNFFSGSIW